VESITSTFLFAFCKKNGKNGPKMHEFESHREVLISGYNMCSDEERLPTNKTQQGRFSQLFTVVDT
jgi:hypothetical protein